MDPAAAPRHTKRMSEEVYLHAGSPRTGTSSFQLFLEVNAEAIRAQGVDLNYPGRDAAKQGTLALRFPAPRHDAGAIEQRLIRARRNLGRVLRPDRPVILSEENICGRMLDFHKGLFFPTAPLRAGFLARALAPRSVARITLVLRPYSEIFVSGYRKRAEDNLQAPFEEHAGKMAQFKGGWVEVISAMREGLKPAEIVLLDYRRRPQAELAGVVCPLLDTSALVEPGREANVSLNDAGLFAMQARLRAGETYTPDLLEEVRLAHAAETADAPFAAFTADAKARLDARYAADLDRLAAMAGVRYRRGE
ncbi:hypothetical protein STA1M1_18160 [Sinisalibacter aestuarii]|uniref:Sulfotransferase family protein n=2 Tax=Sinisalibacter aestuarii TaxID=2949426 RepID=A0ABQ5LSH2_9RHOB|nr:hypothetical protein STA1M1_18160 [Sinisalibacter aestuarii]